MTLARLLAAALLFCALPAFAQYQRPFEPGDVARGTFFALNSDTAAKPEKPWKFIPNQSSDAGAGRNSLDRLQVDKYKVFRSNTDTRTLLVGPDADAGMFLAGADALDADATCLKIRSYVVARDSPTEDSVEVPWAEEGQL